VELFSADVYGNLRRCQGMVRSCSKEINEAGHEVASARIAEAIATMRRYNKFRAPYFQALLAHARKQPLRALGWSCTTVWACQLRRPALVRARLAWILREAGWKRPQSRLCPTEAAWKSL